MKVWCYKWLPIIFGCHCRADRSFYYKGTKFPICARCTGELIGMIVACISCFFIVPSAATAICLMIPMIVDGVVQLKTSYESTNLRRVLTGFLFGYALWSLLVISTIAAVRFGWQWGATW